MTEQTRKIVFISHANPEDNAFTTWLGARLTAVGYDVWADILNLQGGQDWQRELENVIRQKAIKVLLVGTEEGVKKQGVRNEIEIAYATSREINDPEFIIPLHLTKFEPPFRIAHVQHILFDKSWADGLAELIATLHEKYNVPLNASTESAVASQWKNFHLRHAKSINSRSEVLVSNWLRIKKFPELLHFYNFPAEILPNNARSKIRTAPWPTVPCNHGLLTFSPVEDIQLHLGSNFPLESKTSIDTENFLAQGWPSKNIDKWNANKHLSDLVRQSMEKFLKEHSLATYQMAGGQLAWWGKTGIAPQEQIRFSWEDGPSGRRQIIGYSKVKKMYWHYGITPKPWLVPFPHVRIIGRVIFSENGLEPIKNPKVMHRMRRSYTKSWRNPKWRDMMLAFLYWLSDGKGILDIPAGTDTFISLSLPPVSFDVPVSINSSDDEDEEFESSDELSSEDDVDAYSMGEYIEDGKNEKA